MSGSGYVDTPTVTVGGASNRTGTTVTISYGGGKFSHSSPSAFDGHTPRVILSREGLTLGCTFITNQALDRLVAEYTDYKTGSRVIQ